MYLDLSNGLGTTPHVFGRYTLSLVQCVGPAMYVLTATPMSVEKDIIKNQHVTGSYVVLPVDRGNTSNANSGLANPCACNFRYALSIIESGNG